jgi:MoxR-like ATPase
VLLIDEIDRADDEFEAYLLEVLSDFQITIPELGRFTTARPPLVILTSNRTRDVHDALKRRCLYHWVEHPGFEREVKIVRMKAPHVIEPLARQVAAAVGGMRGLNLYKPPGVAETIDWAQALAALGVSELDEATVEATLGTVLKYREDHDKVRQHGIADMVKLAFERGAFHG